jgi:hypothetical protein
MGAMYKSAAPHISKVGLSAALCPFSSPWRFDTVVPPPPLAKKQKSGSKRPTAKKNGGHMPEIPAHLMRAGAAMPPNEQAGPVDA